MCSSEAGVDSPPVKGRRKITFHHADTKSVAVLAASASRGDVLASLVSRLSDDPSTSQALLMSSCCEVVENIGNLHDNRASELNGHKIGRSP